MEDKTTSISIIIPLFRDNESLMDCLSEPDHTHFLSCMTVVLAEEDEEARSICEEHSVHCTTSNEVGRATQMNHGADVTRGDILLFLHADTRLPHVALRRIRNAISEGALGGGFSRRFDHSSRFLKWTCRMADWRGRISGWFLGDQAIFIRRNIFESIGGFSERPQFEDLELTRAMRRLGKTVLLPDPILTSGRRFDSRGPVLQTLLDFMSTLSHLIRKRNTS